MKFPREQIEPDWVISVKYLKNLKSKIENQIPIRLIGVHEITVSNTRDRLIWGRKILDPTPHQKMMISCFEKSHTDDLDIPTDEIDVCLGPDCGGGPDRKIIKDENGIYHVECPKCGARGSGGVTKEIAIENWNDLIANACHSYGCDEEKKGDFHEKIKSNKQ